MGNQIELPHFKYVPNAYELGLFRKEDFTCDICETKQHYLYTGPLYMENEKSTGTFKVTNTEHKICAHCIENGKAAEKLNADFKDIDILEEACYNKEHIDEEQCESVMKTWLYHTPNFYGIETELWPICCSNFTAFTGYLGSGEKAAESLNIDTKSDLNDLTATLEGETVEHLYSKILNALNIEAERLKEKGSKIKNGSELAEKLQDIESNTVGYLFKCIDCDQYRVHVDFLQK